MARMDADVKYDPVTRIWTLRQAFFYEMVDPVEIVAIEKGYQFDLASIPRLIWMLMSPFDLSIEAPLIHDHLYEMRGFGKWNRKEADQRFKKEILDRGVYGWKAAAAYRAVRMFGWLFWRK